MLSKKHKYGRSWPMGNVPTDYGGDTIPDWNGANNYWTMDVNYNVELVPDIEPDGENNNNPTRHSGSSIPPW